MWESLYVEAGDRNSISNKGIHAQCPSINDLLIALATSDWTSLSQLFSASNQWPADEELDGFSGRCGFVLEREREKKRGSEREK